MSARWLLAALLLVAAPALAQEKPADEERQAQEKEEARLLKKARRLAEDDDQKQEAWTVFMQLAELARTREHEETWLTALEESRAVAPSPPDEARVLGLIGHIHMTRSEHRESVKAFRRACKLVPESAPGWNSLGYALHLAGDEDESVEAFEKCIELDSANKEARYSLGVAARLAGKPMKALRQHERLVEAGEKGELTLSWYFAWESQVAKKTGKGFDMTSAASRVAVCKLEVAIDHVFLDELDQAEETIAKLVAKTDKDDLAPAVDVALDEVERAVELRPHELQLHWLLGQLHEAKGEKEKAKAEYEKFIAAEKPLRALAKKAKEKLESKD